jgi:regulator of protease activity HflC (stomatin/prohibitin superfamily)
MFLKYNNGGDCVGPTMFGVLMVVGLVAALIITPLFFETVSPGTVKVGYRFGKYTETIQQGMHFPVNPLVSWRTVDTKQKTVKLEDVSLPSQDQLTSMVDVSVQYRAINTAGDTIISGTGDVETVIDVHLFPKAAELVRDAGRHVEKAESLFLESTVNELAANMTAKLRAFMEPKGILVEVVLWRHIDLPPFIVKGIEQKKLREQKAQEQIAELARFETEQQQVIKTAEADKKAAVLTAEQIKILADAEAYRIKVVNEAVANNPAYIQLQSLEALKAMAKDPAAKLIIMDGSSMSPIPFLNLGASLGENK